jgi:hypothetical protein
MTYPTEFRTQSKTIGSSAILHPIYVFSISLDRLKSETFGPNTNSRSVNLLHPDLSNQSPDYGNTLLSGHDLVKKHSWIAGFLRAENIDINDDGTITAYGQKGQYLKERFADVANPILTVLNYAPYTSTSQTRPSYTYSEGNKHGLFGAGTATVSGGGLLYIQTLTSAGVTGAGAAYVVQNPV